MLKAERDEHADGWQDGQELARQRGRCGRHPDRQAHQPVAHDATAEDLHPGMQCTAGPRVHDNTVQKRSAALHLCQHLSYIRCTLCSKVLYH